MDFNTIQEVLKDIGVEVSASIICDLLKQSFGGQATIPAAELEQHLNGFLYVHGKDVTARDAIKVLAENGLISIDGSMLTAHDEIRMGAGSGAEFRFGDGRSQTADTAIVGSGGSQIVATNNAEIVQKDGTISFRV